VEGKRRLANLKPLTTASIANALRTEVTSRDDRKLRRIRDFLAVVDAPAIDARRPWSRGTAFLTPTLPKVWDANYLSLERLDDIDAGAIDAEATEVGTAAGLAHTAIVVADERVGARLARSLDGLGYDTTRFSVMTLRSAPEEPAVEVELVDGAEVAASRRELTLESFPGDDELADQLAELDRRLATVPSRWFAVREDGEVLARAWLRADGRIAQVEDVATTPTARGRGLARAVVSTAAAVAAAEGHDLTFVITDADETTPALYRKVGFEPLAITYRFVKTLR
jgi:GNAT superfamily N-acetyltransferase